MKKLLEVRKRMKKRKPTFVQTDTHWKIRIKPVWRRPRGLHNKMRLGRASYPATVEVGYRSPKAVRGLSSEGKHIVTISTLSELKAQDKDVVVEIKKSVGKKNRIAIMTEAKKLGIRIKNVKDITKALDEINKAFEARKAAKKKRGDKKAAKAKAKKETKKETKAEQNEEAKDQDEEKREQEKTLTKRL